MSFPQVSANSAFSSPFQNPAYFQQNTFQFQQPQQSAFNFQTSSQQVASATEQPTDWQTWQQQYNENRSDSGTKRNFSQMDESSNPRSGRKRTFRDFEEEDEDGYRQAMGEPVDYMSQPDAAVSDLKRIRTIAQEHEIDPEPPTEETIHLMFETGCVLFCRGKPFEDKLRERLTSRQWDEWSHKKTMFEGGHPIPPSLHPEILEKLETIKTEQIFAFVVHFQDMPPGVKLTFAKLYEGFPELLNRLIQGFDDTLDFGMILTSMWYDLVTYHM